MIHFCAHVVMHRLFTTIGHFAPANVWLQREGNALSKVYFRRGRFLRKHDIDFYIAPLHFRHSLLQETDSRKFALQVELAVLQSPGGKIIIRVPLNFQSVVGIVGFYKLMLKRSLLTPLLIKDIS